MVLLDLLLPLADAEEGESLAGWLAERPLGEEDEARLASVISVPAVDAEVLPEDDDWTQPPLEELARLAKEAPLDRTFRLGGLVEKGSVKRDGVMVNFVVTDTFRQVPVRYQGILPDLFKEGKGVVAQGKLGADGVFMAQEVLAKHDENYMPPEAAEALKRAAQANARIEAGQAKEPK